MAVSSVSFHRVYIHLSWSCVFLLHVTAAVHVVDEEESVVPPLRQKTLVIGIDAAAGHEVKKIVKDHKAFPSSVFRDVAEKWGAATVFDAEPTEVPTISGAGWSSILRGVRIPKHKVFNNEFHGSEQYNHPTFFDYLRSKRPSLHSRSRVSWAPINSFLSCAKCTTNCATNCTTASDNSVHLQAVLDVSEQGTPDEPDVFFYHFDDVDTHRPDPAEKMRNLRQTEEYVGNIWSAVQKRSSFKEETWLFIRSTDHGSLPSGEHDEGTQAERNSFAMYVLAHGDEVGHVKYNFEPLSSSQSMIELGHQSADESASRLVAESAQESVVRLMSQSSSEPVGRARNQSVVSAASVTGKAATKKARRLSNCFTQTLEPGEVPFDASLPAMKNPQTADVMATVMCFNFGGIEPSWQLDGTCRLWTKAADCTNSARLSLWGGTAAAASVKPALGKLAAGLPLGTLALKQTLGNAFGMSLMYGVMASPLLGALWLAMPLAAEALSAWA